MQKQKTRVVYNNTQKTTAQGVDRLWIAYVTICKNLEVYQVPSHRSSHFDYHNVSILWCQ